MSRSKPELGEKRVCQSCEAPFYDLGRVPPTCPKCGAEYVVIVRPPPTPRQNQKRVAFGKAYPAPLPEAEALPEEDSEDERETDDEPEEEDGAEEEEEA